MYFVYTNLIYLLINSFISFFVDLGVVSFNLELNLDFYEM